MKRSIRSRHQVKQRVGRRSVDTFQSGSRIKTEQTKKQVASVSWESVLPRIGLSGPKCRRVNFNHRPGQHIGSPIRRHHQQNAEPIGSSPRNRSAQAGQNQHDSIETSTSLPADRPDLRSAPSASARAQIAIRGLIAPAPSRAPDRPPARGKDSALPQSQPHPLSKRPRAGVD